MQPPSFTCTYPGSDQRCCAVRTLDKAPQAGKHAAEAGCCSQGSPGVALPKSGSALTNRSPRRPPRTHLQAAAGAERRRRVAQQQPLPQQIAAVSEVQHAILARLHRPALGPAPRAPPAAPAPRRLPGRDLLSAPPAIGWQPARRRASRRKVVTCRRSGRPTVSWAACARGGRQGRVRLRSALVGSHLGYCLQVWGLGTRRMQSCWSVSRGGQQR